MSNVMEISDSQFPEAVADNAKPVLAYFWAQWCGPCRLVSPSVSWIADNYCDRIKVIKLEVDASPESVARCKVEGVPALRLFQGGEIINSYEGAIGKEKLKEFIQSVIND